MKAITREIFVHLVYVLLAQLVTNASLDDNSFWLAENARKFMLENAVTESYFGGTVYELKGGVVSFPEPERAVRHAVADGPMVIRGLINK